MSYSVWKRLSRVVLAAALAGCCVPSVALADALDSQNGEGDTASIQVKSADGAKATASELSDVDSDGAKDKEASSSEVKELGDAPSSDAENNDEKSDGTDGADGAISILSLDADDEATDIDDKASKSSKAAKSSATVDATALATLIDNLDKRFATGGDYATLVPVYEVDGYTYISAVYADAALALYQHGKSASIDLSSLKENYSLLYSAGQIAKAAIIFKAAGVDPSAVEIDGTVHNVIADMESMLFVDGTVSASIYDLVYILPAYKFTGATLSDAVASQLIDAILATQVADTSDDCYGLFGTMSEYDGVVYDSHGAQVTAQAILALAPYVSQSSVASAITNATTAIDKLQNSDGGFNEGYGFNAYESIDTTGSIVAAYAALGKDIEAACAFLVNEAAGSNYSGYEYSALSYDPSYTAPTALMGLVAYTRAAEMGGTYDMFGAYVVPAASTEVPEQTPAQPSTATEDVLAATGDFAGPAGACAAAGALGAGVVAAAAMKRARRRVA